MEARLDFVLLGAGWASIEISAGTFKHTIEGISYTTDALDDLLRMGIDIATDKTWSMAEFDLEPDLTVLVAETAWVENNDWILGARLSSFDGSPFYPTGISRRTIRDARRDFILPVSSGDELATMFLRAGQRVLEQHGAEGYREAWGGRLAFPLRALRALEAALSLPANPANNFG